MSRPKAQDIYGYEGRTAYTAHVEDRDTWTGLYDHNGQELHRPRDPIGFNPHRWDAKPKPPPMRVSHGGRSSGGNEHPKGAPCKICDKEKKRN